MENDFTIDEIKNSVEYQWRRGHIKAGLKLWSIVAVVIFFVTLFYEVAFDFEFLAVAVATYLCMVGITGLVFLGVSLFEYRKMIYLLKNYQKFNSYEAVLDRFSNSFFYRRSVYYTVTVNYEGCTKKVDTNPYFSSAFLSEFTCEDFNNKKVIGLYDDEKEKFYLLKRV